MTLPSSWASLLLAVHLLHPLQPGHGGTGAQGTGAQGQTPDYTARVVALLNAVSNAVQHAPCTALAPVGSVFFLCILQVLMSTAATNLH